MSMTNEEKVDLFGKVEYIGQTVDRIAEFLMGKSVAPNVAPENPTSSTKPAINDNEVNLPSLPKIEVSNYKSPEDAISYAKSIGGAQILFTGGDYACALIIDTPNIQLISTGGTILRAKGSPTVVDVKAGGTGFVLDGFDVRGQTLLQESISNKGGTVKNTSALHCIRIQERGARLRNFKTRGAYNDGIYFLYDGNIDFEAKDFFIDSTSRNPVSIIAGEGFKFLNGRIRLDNQYSGAHSGLHLLDCEPNSVANKYRDITFKNVTFENAGTKSGNSSVILQDTNILDRGRLNDLGVVIEDCDFIASGAAAETGNSAFIWFKSKSLANQFCNIRVTRTKHGNRVMMAADKQPVTLRDAIFDDVELTNIASFAWSVFLGEDSIANNIRTSSNNNVGMLLFDKASNVKVSAVKGYAYRP